MPAEISDGASAWSKFVGSVGRTLTANAGSLPLIGLAILLLLIVLADWKLAGWMERRLRGGDTPHQRGPDASRRNAPRPGRTGAHPHR